MPKKERKLPANLAKIGLLIRAKDENEKLILSKPHVIGLDVGYRVKDDKVTNECVVTVCVSRKIKPSELAKEHIIPNTIKIDNQQVPVDVVEGTIDQPCNFTLRSRPLRGGSSIGPANIRIAIGVGTLGVCVTLNDGNTYILSNNHVIANSNQAPIGSGIVQPSLIDGGNAANDTVADLSDFVPLDFGTTTITIFGYTFNIPNRNYVDAAIAEVRNDYNDGNREIHWIGYPHPLRRGKWNFFERLSLLGRRVCKMGRTSEFTTGIITSVSYDNWIGPYNGQNAYFKDQIRIKGEDGPFAIPGDSGALVVDFETREPIGLLFSRGGDFGNANPIHEVLARLNIPQI